MDQVRKCKRCGLERGRTFCRAGRRLPEGRLSREVLPGNFFQGGWSVLHSGRQSRGLERFATGRLGADVPGVTLLGRLPPKVRPPFDPRDSRLSGSPHGQMPTVGKSPPPPLRESMIAAEPAGKSPGMARLQAMELEDNMRANDALPLYRTERVLLALCLLECCNVRMTNPMRS